MTTETPEADENKRDALIDVAVRNMAVRRLSSLAVTEGDEGAMLLAAELLESAQEQNRNLSSKPYPTPDEALEEARKNGTVAVVPITTSISGLGRLVNQLKAPGLEKDYSLVTTWGGIRREA